MSIRSIAIYLPQFHPIPENDEWWGKGFTEWTNVAKAQPLFEGHYQPHLPADLGFYDLRLEETRIAQAALAKEYDIYGFCYYHYWFNGKQILERPFREVLKTGKPDFPFMLCWANENWTRTWDGLENNVLLKQEYSEQDDIAHIRALIPAFKDNRYIRVDNKAVFAIYRSTRIPDVKNTIRTWRNEAEKEGIQLYLCRMETFGEKGQNYLSDGFDAAINFHPDFQMISKIITQRSQSEYRNRPFSHLHNLFSLKKKGNKPFESVNLVDYNSYLDYLKGIEACNYKIFPCVTPMWDNSSRRKNNYFAFKCSTPEKYQEWLEFELEKFKPFSGQENFIFINAWNEWAEGNHLEPCQKWGTKYLEATKAVLEKYV